MFFFVLYLVRFIATRMRLVLVCGTILCVRRERIRGERERVTGTRVCSRALVSKFSCCRMLKLTFLFVKTLFLYGSQNIIMRFNILTLNVPEFLFYYFFNVVVFCALYFVTIHFLFRYLSL